MNKSPFQYGTPVSGKSFTNRREEIQKLRNNFLSGIHTIIISPRKWGKSSLVEKVTSDLVLNKKTIKVIKLDLFAIDSSPAFLEKFAAAVIRASSGKWDDWIKNIKTFFKQLIPKIQMSPDPTIELNLTFEWQDLKNNVEEVLNLPENIARNKKLSFIICIDEFQQLANYKEFDSFEKKLRSAWQHHKNVTYCLYGSKRHMMLNIFSDSSKPFYRFGDLLLLSRISSEHWVKFIVKGFSSTHKEITSEYALAICSAMKNQSWYVQQFANYTWTKTDSKVSRKILEEALTELIGANVPFFQREIEGMNRTQINFLKAMANGESQFTSSTVMNKYQLGTPRNVSKNKISLLHNDIIGEEESGVEFLDPAFELWFKQEYLNWSFLLTLPQNG